MGRHRSNHRSTRTILPAFPVQRRPGTYSRSTYRRPFSIQQQRQPDAVGYRRRQRIRQRRHRERIRRDRIGDAQGPALCPHWVVVSDHDVSAGFPGVFWWRLA